MTQERIRRPATPKQALACKSSLDGRVDVELFRALGDPTRAALLTCLAKCRRACSVGEIAECCSVDLSVVSRHLALLERAGVLSSAKEGRTVLYSVRHEPLSRALRDLADAIDECCSAVRAGSRESTCCEPRPRTHSVERPPR